MNTLHAGMLSIDFVRTRARRNDPDTSKAAARHAASTKMALERAAILAAVKAAPDGLTGREMSEVTGIEYYEAQKRKSEVAGIYESNSPPRGGQKVWRAV